MTQRAAKLLLACERLDRAEDCRKQIEKDGAALRSENRPPRDHPLLRAEQQNRAFVALSAAPRRCSTLTERGRASCARRSRLGRSRLWCLACQRNGAPAVGG